MNKKDDEQEKQSRKAKKWIAELCAAEKYFKNSQMRGDDVIKRYTDERNSESTSHKYNILWANTETQKPHVYSLVPRPNVERRYLESDLLTQDPQAREQKALENKIARQAAEVLQRALIYCIDSHDFHGVCKQAREDYLLPGRAIARVHYTPVFGEAEKTKVKVNQMDEGYEDDAGNMHSEATYDDDLESYVIEEEFNPVVYEKAEIRHINRKNFLHQPAQCWEDVGWVAFAENLSRDELIERFGDIGLKVPRSAKSYGESKDDDSGLLDKKGRVWEIWDKVNKKVYWVCKDYNESLLDESDPPINLENFYPCPEPLFIVTTNDTMKPIPEYTMYQDQADELDELTARIDKIMEGLKVIGVYPAELETVISNLFRQSENTLVPVENWTMFMEKGGMSGVIGWYPVREVAEVLQSLYLAREDAKQSLYEITGLSDIFRGKVDPREKAAQSRIKASFGSQRMQDKTQAFAFFVRDLIRLLAEVISEQFSRDTLSMISGMNVEQPVVELISSDALRGFKIDIETDSTVAPDEEMEKQRRIEFLTAAGEFIEKSVPMAKQVPEMAPLLGEMLLFGIRGFRVGRALEAKFEEAVQTLQAQAQNAQNQEPQPTPDEIKAQAAVKNADANMAKAQADGMKAQSEAQKVQGDIDEKSTRRIMDTVAYLGNNSE
jgi:hypothetical protein